MAYLSIPKPRVDLYTAPSFQYKMLLCAPLRMALEHLAGCCRDNNLVLNVDEMKEMIIDFRRWRPEHTPLSVSFSDVQICDDLAWPRNATRLYLFEETETSVSPGKGCVVVELWLGGGLCRGRWGKMSGSLDSHYLLSIIFSRASLRKMQRTLPKVP